MTATSRFDVIGSTEGLDHLLRVLGIELEEVGARRMRDAEELTWLLPLRQTSSGTDPNPTLALLGRAFADALRRQFAADPAAKGRLSAICERLFVECVRGRLAQLQPDQTGGLVALRDPVIGRALSLLHAQAQQDWTVRTLAQKVNMSRSAFAKRFMAVVGQPPRKYLTTWRMQLAVRQLLETRQTIAQIAYGLGYETDTGFGRAFCREFGISPAGLAQERRADRPGGRQRAVVC